MHIVSRTVAAVLLAIALCACHRQSESTPPEKHYSLSGKVIALNAKDQTATVDASAIPNFMEAMTMEYPIASKTEFDTLRVGDKIKATVNVRDDGLYDLSHIEKQNSATTR